MSKAACGKKAACNPPMRDIIEQRGKNLIDSVDQLLRLVPLQTGEIESFIAADEWALKFHKEKIRPLVDALNEGFCERYEASYAAVMKRLEAED